MTILKVAERAEEIFGKVISVTLVEEMPHGDFFFVACERTDPAHKDRPYMTITGKYDHEKANKGMVSFFGGHYDLTQLQAHDQIQKYKYTQIQLRA